MLASTPTIIVRIQLESSVKIVVEKNENTPKEVGDGPFFKKVLYERHCRIFQSPQHLPATFGY